MPTDLDRESLVAPCGLDCRLCRAYIRTRKHCPGCRSDDSRSKSNYCLTCKIKNCAKLEPAGARFCFSCDEFPCALVRHLDKRYRTSYGLSTIENLLDIQKLGIRRFVALECERWLCPACGETLCMHKPQCPACGHVWRE